MSCSYGIIHRASRHCTIVNGGPGTHVDVVVDIKPFSETRDTVEIFDGYKGMESDLFDDGPYKTARMIFTADKGSVLTATYLYFNKKGRAKDYVVSEHRHQSAFKTARLVLWCERVRHDKSKVVEDSVKRRKLRKEKEDDNICVICLEEFHAQDMIGTLECNHSYHDECIKNWLMENTKCPLCRSVAVCYDYESC